MKPLDPTKVKAGDTVTLKIHDPEMAPFEVQGPAYDGPEGVMAGAWPLVGHPHVTLTDHQPEPDYRGQFVTASLNGAEVSGFVDSNRDFHGMEDGFHRFALVESLSDVRPLAVIDPAAVDVDALANALRREWTGKDFGVTFSWDAIAATVLHELGIEAS